MGDGVVEEIDSGVKGWRVGGDGEDGLVNGNPKEGRIGRMR